MPKIIRDYANNNQPIVRDGDLLDLVHFNRVELEPGGGFEQHLPRHECVVAVLSGTVDIVVDGERFEGVGRRKDIWSGPADSLYAPADARVTIENAGPGKAEVAIGGGLTSERHAAFRIPPEDVAMVDVGSPETHSRRRIFHILGQNGHGRAGNLLVSELYADDGCWSGYPPHKHDTDRAEGGETDHEELYHFRYLPESGFGAQVLYADGAAEDCYVVRNGDTVLIDRGYHPTVTSPGHRAYIFTVLVGRRERGLVQYFDPRHAHLTERIPGIQAMRDKFK